MTRAEAYLALAWLLVAATVASLGWAATKPLHYLSEHRYQTGEGGTEVTVLSIAIVGCGLSAIACAARLLASMARSCLRPRAERGPGLTRRDAVGLSLVVAIWFFANFAVLYSLDRSFTRCGGTTPYCYQRTPFEVYEPLVDAADWLGWHGGCPFYVAEYEDDY